jgi:hypothetical protein
LHVVIGKLHPDKVVYVGVLKDWEDLDRLIRHFSTWGMQHLKGTRYVFAAPDALRDSRTPQWPPCVIHDRWNTCYVCGEWVNIEAGEGQADEDGANHFGCEYE